MQVDAWSMTDIGRIRQSNQDAVACFHDLNLFLVADGMGGHADGGMASQLTVAAIREFFADQSADGGGDRIGARFRRFIGVRPPSPAPTTTCDPVQLDAAIRRANQRVFEAGHAAPAVDSRPPSGTTVVVLRLTPDQACWAHVGDSRLYRVRDQHLELLTADHTVYGEPYLDKARIPTDLPHTNKLTEAVGIRLDLRVATGCEAILPGDLFLLCSDGISGLLSAAIILEQLTSTDQLAVAGKNLIRLAMEAGGRDNASVVLVRVVT